MHIHHGLYYEHSDVIYMPTYTVYWKYILNIIMNMQ